ncbi:MAG: sulfurtransferase-like selenium metabolism protein YedF [Clostridia bacterium]|nr:sulfurtransferase-like selenium metabolism protein YedF [Clostridia bacterium]
MTNEVTVDARGLACPRPVINTKEAVEAMTGPGTVRTLVDNEIAVQNLQKFAAQRGLKAAAEKKSDNEFEVVLEVGEGQSAPAAAEITCTPDRRSGGLVVVFDSDSMGHGADKLGRILTKAFIFALTKQDELPEIMLFFNSGAFLTSADSESLEDLKALEAAGVSIRTCGTCMDFYNIAEKLAVGSPTNMYEIVDAMEHAGRLVKP